ncbi:hypothetical protein RF11_07678 [Thelohanellus kitauei]|uniref:Uncharacterized protein n=1 Tax=Thelohanellus kitauei TaxID=669202 RepID=A0A0C2JDT1_THEKT|nr:hypothetical protein RF11_07678 [Thelohanellus kitauei]
MICHVENKFSIWLMKGELCGRPHVVIYQNTFVYSTGKKQFKGLHEASIKIFFIEWMMLGLEECQVTSVYEIATDLFNLIKIGSIEIKHSHCDSYYRNMLKCIRQFS